MRLTLSSFFVTLITTSVCSAAYADCSTGFYIGGQAGFGSPSYNTYLQDQLAQSTQKNGFKTQKSYKEGGAAGRLYAGYQFNQYFGAETGFTMFADNTYKISSSDSYGDSFSFKTTYKTEQWDILAKAGTPFGNSGFRADIRAGAAYLYSRQNVNFNLHDSYTNTNIIVNSGNSSGHKWVPAAGASMGYNFTQDFAMDIAYLHGFGPSGNNSAVPKSTDLATLGISYLFA
jgi:hypothetical protein